MTSRVIEATTVKSFTERRNAKQGLYEADVSTPVNLQVETHVKKTLDSNCYQDLIVA